MADYKRMVSYMYLYENGVKKKNVGYARVESRDGECKFTLHMQLLGLLDSIFPTYLIQRQGDEMELIYLGDSFLKNQVLDSKLTASEHNIMGSGYGLSHMGGILLFLNESIFFATEWDDKPVLLNEVMEALKSKKKEEKLTADSSSLGDNENKSKESNEPDRSSIPVNFKPIQEETPANDQKDESNQQQKNRLEDRIEKSRQETNTIVWDTKPSIKNMPINDMAQVMGDSIDDNYSGWNKIKASKSGNNEKREENGSNTYNIVEDISVPVYKLPGGWKTIEYHQKSQGDKIETNPWKLVSKYREGQKTLVKEGSDPLEEAKAKQDQHKAATTIQAQPKAATTIQAQPKAATTIQDQPKEAKTIQGQPNEDIHQVQAEPQKEFQRKESELFAAADQFTEEELKTADRNFNKEGAEKPENPLASRLFENYPRIYPFEDNEITLCVKIEPKDIGFLPVDSWVLSNNSFLLHGYYCYHHLIFAKIQDRFGCRYILGVPGIYHNRERFMARMFGFDCFKSIRRRELRQGDFGYWYIQISM